MRVWCWCGLLVACAPEPPEPIVDETGSVDWTLGLPSLADELGSVRGRIPLRSVIHVHSPWSHDACDGNPHPDGVPNEPCLEDLRRALCDTAIDVAFVTDHPGEAAFQTYSDMMLVRPGDEPVVVDEKTVGNLITCESGHQVTWLPGIEDELMPVGLDRHVSDDPLINDQVYNSQSLATIEEVHDAGGLVLVNHAEGRSRDDMLRLQDDGVDGMEVFQLHAMFAPDIREDDLGLEGLAWLLDIAPFTAVEATAAPDLLFLGVLQEQSPNVDHWDALLARGPMVGIGGTDAHQNVMPLTLADQDRGDSYRRMFRWFSNWLYADDAGARAAEEALAAGRTAIVFEALGRPDGFDLHLEDADGVVYDMGSRPPSGGTLHVGCPTLSRRSPKGEEEPGIIVNVFRDGALWRSECGSHDTDGPGVYRVRVDVIPHHLRPFLGEEPDVWIVSYPWVYSNAIVVER